MTNRKEDLFKKRWSPLAYKKPPKSLKWRDAERTIKALGAVFIRQKGSHRHYKRKVGDQTHPIVIPTSDDIDGALLSNIIRQTGVGRRKFWGIYLGK